MSPDYITKMYSEEGFRENTPAHLALERHYGFGYRNLLGELMYAYVSSRPDIGYAVLMLLHGKSQLQQQQQNHQRELNNGKPCE